MTKKKICLIRSNPVNPDSRVEKIAWSLVKNGYDVQLLGWDRESNHPEENRFIHVVDIEIPIVLFGHKANYGDGLKSLKPFLKFQINMVRWLIKHRNEYSIIHACDFDTAYLASKVAHICRKKLVYDIFDFLYGEPSNMMQRCIKRMQINIINSATATIICTEDRKKQINGSNPQKLVVIHNTPFKEQMNSEGNFISEKTNKIKIAYVGILANERLLSSVGKCISRHPELELHIAGFGYLHNYFEELACNHDNIRFYKKISYDQALSLESNCDIMLAIYNPESENCRFAAPNKFYESLMLGKPVIMAKGTGMSHIVEDNDIGALIDFSEEGFEKGLVDLIRRKEQWPAMSQKMRILYGTHYSWELMEKRLIDLYDYI